MFLLSGIFVLVVLLLGYSLPHGPPPREHDGSISLATFIRYESQAWKGHWIIGSEIGAIIFFALGCWRWIKGRKHNASSTTA